MNSTPKFCKDCKHYAPERSKYMLGGGDRARCLHPINMVWNLSEGHKYDVTSPAEMRGDGIYGPQYAPLRTIPFRDLCGRDGKLFQPKGTA